MKKIAYFIGVFLCSMWNVQAQSPDTVEIEFGKGSKMVIYLKDGEDAEALKELDFDEVIEMLEQYKRSGKTNGDTIIVETENSRVRVEIEDDEEKDDEKTYGIHISNGQIRVYNDNGQRRNRNRKRLKHRVNHDLYVDLGLNSYLEDGSTVSGQTHELRPLGSRYVAIGSLFRHRLNKGRTPIYFKYGLEISWYNFMFENDNRIAKGENEVVFFTENFDLKKSKLTASYLNVPVMFTVGKSYRNNFILGFGGYVGYRLGSHSKIVYFEDGDKKKDKDHNNFHLNDFRYGFRTEIGVGRRWGGVTLFGNYDVNKLFRDGKAPALNAFSFGVRL